MSKLAVMVIIDEGGNIRLFDNGKHIGQLNMDPAVTYKEIEDYQIKKAVDRVFKQMLQNTTDDPYPGVTRTKSVINNEEVSSRLKDRLNELYPLKAEVEKDPEFIKKYLELSKDEILKPFEPETDIEKAERIKTLINEKYGTEKGEKNNG